MANGTATQVAEDYENAPTAATTAAAAVMERGENNMKRTHENEEKNKITNSVPESEKTDDLDSVADNMKSLSIHTFIEMVKNIKQSKSVG